ncbi:neuralized-like protein 4 [Glandiceps talaboti]
MERFVELFHDYLHVTKESRPTSASSAPSAWNEVDIQCGYYKLCQKFVLSLGLQDSIFSQEIKKDQCFCYHCHSDRKDHVAYKRAGSVYALPIGWVRFGLKIIPDRNKAYKWHVGYHGTKVSCVDAITRTMVFLKPGSADPEGGSVRPRIGHFNAKYGPSDFNWQQIFASPTIKYSGNDAYATPESWSFNDIKFEARVAFQVWMEPGAYTIGRETIGAGSEKIDPIFSNDNLEWRIDDPDKIIPFGLLVKLH